jgi:hypothetical protein
MKKLRLMNRHGGECNDDGGFDKRVRRCLPWDSGTDTFDVTIFYLIYIHINLHEYYKKSAKPVVDSVGIRFSR